VEVKELNCRNPWNSVLIKKLIIEKGIYKGNYGVFHLSRNQPISSVIFRRNTVMSTKYSTVNRERVEEGQLLLLLLLSSSSSSSSSSSLLRGPFEKFVD
jgi:hypothetical protein